ncbi:MAG: chromosome partitioning protein [Microbacterium sp.]|nr:MAG: chromosome partitioning protein [Microbacterium sp.]PZU32891.1 MAG: chromosome partitioning protein [Microbacterium sp.]
MDVRDYFRILHKNWLMIALVVLISTGGALAYSLTRAPEYRSTAQLYVSVRSDGAATGDLVQGTNFARQIVASYVDVVPTALVLQPVIDQLVLDTTVDQLASQITADTPQNTVNISIAVTDTDLARAAAIADATAASLTDAVQNTLERPSTEGAQSSVQLTTVQPAIVPDSPISPNVPLNVALGAILGLAAGIGLAALRTAVDTRLRTLHDLESITGAPVLGGIAYDPDAPKRPLIVSADPRNPRSESFRALRTNLQFLNTDAGSRIFVVSSSGPGEGKSTTTANLAIALSETGARVALIDGDLRKPRIADYMGIEGGVGLTSALIGRVELTDALQKWGAGQLFVLPSGPIPPNPAEMLGSPAMGDVLSALAAHFDYVLIDAPPLLLVTDAAVLAAKSTGVIMVAAAGRTKKQDLIGALRTLDTASGRLLGVIGTMLPTRGPDSYGYRAYGYGPASTDAPAPETPLPTSRSRAGRA